MKRILPWAEWLVFVEFLKTLTDEASIYRIILIVSAFPRLLEVNTYVIR